MMESRISLGTNARGGLRNSFEKAAILLLVFLMFKKMITRNIFI